MKWEYMSIDLGLDSGSSLDSRLCYWGRSGWELVGFHENRAVFKCPIHEGTIEVTLTCKPTFKDQLPELLEVINKLEK